MRRKAILLLATAAIGGVVCAPLINPAPARALPSPASLLGSLGSGACKIIGTVGEGWWGTACNGAVGVAQKVSSIAGKLSSAGKKVAKVAGTVSSNGLVQRGAGLAAIVAWVLGGAKWTMDHMQSVITHTTSPALTAGWFTGVYLKIEAIALLFTLLFLFAAAAEALLRQDSAVLARAVCVYLPLAALGTAIATPVIMILLAATDQLSSGMATIAGQNATHFSTGTTAWVAAGLTAADPFFAAMAGGLVVAAGGALWVEMLIREIAVYVIMAMLPLAFAAMVWPARRVWAIRALEVLIALILSKMLIVAVLALGTAALAHASGALNRLLGGLALVLIGAFTPWVLLRLIPMSEVASAAVGHIRGHLHNTAGMRTPEAALAGKATERAFGNGSPGSAAGGVGVSEMLEQMLRNAQKAETSAHASEEPARPTATNGFEAGLNGNGTETAAAAPPAAAAAGPSDHTGDRRPGSSTSPASSASPTTSNLDASAPLSPPARGQRAPAQASSQSAPSEEETMVQQADGSWQPLSHTDENAPIPPAPWEQPADVPAAQAPPPVVPDPQDDRLGSGTTDAGPAETANVERLAPPAVPDPQDSRLGAEPPSPQPPEAPPPSAGPDREGGAVGGGEGSAA